VLVTEAEIEDGFRFVYERAKLAVRAGRRAAVAAVLAGRSNPPHRLHRLGRERRPQTAAAILASR
jgi:hypothetical protein